MFLVVRVSELRGRFVVKDSRVSVIYPSCRVSNRSVLFIAHIWHTYAAHAYIQLEHRRADRDTRCYVVLSYMLLHSHAHTY